MQVQSSRPPKGNSLHKNTSYDVQTVKIGPPFLHARHFTQPQNPMLYNAFQSARPTKSAPSSEGICTPCNTCSLNPHDPTSQTAS